jgi:hypothetical protein
MSKDESLNGQTDKKDIDVTACATSKSPKNMAGYADDKEIDPKLMKVGELIAESREENNEPDYCCSDDDLMEAQKQRKEALEAERFKSGK